MSYDVNKVIQIASAEVGYLEKKTNSNLDSKTGNAGENNFTKYWADMAPGMNGNSWCNCFVNWCFVKAYGEAAAKKLLCSEAGWSYYTPTSAGYFKTAKQWYSTPQKGDIIYFKNSQRICHVGIVYEVSGSTVKTIEGNTSAGAGVVANGGGVAKKSYSLSASTIAGFGRPTYGTVASKETATENAYTQKDFIKEIQKVLGVSATGKANKALLSKTPTVSMVKNNKHAVVEPIQKYLKALGYGCGVTGSAGSKFDAAVKSFQKDNGCTADGEITSGAETWKKLLGLA